MPKPLTVQEFFKRFPDDDACLDHLMTLRYGESLDCPKCGKHGRFSRIRKMPAYQCSWCGYHIHPMAGTPFERSRTPLQKWFYAIYLFTTTRHGVAAKELQRQLGVTYKCAWRMGHMIRKHMGEVDGDSGLSGHVEIDETYVGGKPRSSAPSKSGPYLKNKSVVLGMVQRGGDIITRVVPNAKMRTLRPHVLEHVTPGTRVSTDQYGAYRTILFKKYAHGSVNHAMKEWVRGETHTNTLEGFWSHFKNSVRGTHKSVSKQHLYKYLIEFEFRYNLRKDKTNSMFDRLILAF